MVVLVVDDEQMIRTFVGVLLQKDGHEVLAARNGVEGIALFRSYADRIHLVITDMKMPLMDGATMIELIRQTRPQTRIICMTGYSEIALPEGVVALPKPFTPEVLRDCVQRAMG